MKLTKVQQETLNKMEKGKWHNAYELKVSLNTVYALQRKGLVKVKRGLGSMWYPRLHVQFKKVDA